MYILDTNVISELMRPSPDRAVEAWLYACAPRSLLTTVVTESELWLGVNLLPTGTRRALLTAKVDAAMSIDFAGRILPFDRVAARIWAEIVAGRRALGRPIAHGDAQIAAIARAHGSAVVTRDIDDFAGCGVELIDPWAVSPA